MRTAERAQVRALPLFRNISRGSFEALIKLAFLQRFPSWMTLLHEGQSPEFLYVVVKGLVDVYSTWSGGKTTIDVVVPKGTLCLSAVVRNEVSVESARTLMPSQVLMIPADAVRAVLDGNAVFACAVADELAANYRSVVRRLEDQKLRPGVTRLANWILETDRRQGNRGRIELPYEKRTLAAVLGMKPESLSRTLAKITAYGIAGSGKEILITDREALRRWAKRN